MDKNINIRKVTKGDAKTLAYIQTESWKSAFNKILSKEDLEKYSDINVAIEMYDMLLNENIANGYILFIDDKPHCIAYWDNSREEQQEGCAEIICIHSLSSNWGKGYGSIMMKHILKEIKVQGFSKVILWVFKENYRARKFYENHGFVLSEKSKAFISATEVMYYKEI